MFWKHFHKKSPKEFFFLHIIAFNLCFLLDNFLCEKKMNKKNCVLLRIKNLLNFTSWIRLVRATITTTVYQPSNAKAVQVLEHFYSGFWWRFWRHFLFLCKNSRREWFFLHCVLFWIFSLFIVCFARLYIFHSGIEMNRII